MERKAEVIFTLNDWTVNETWSLNVNQSIKKVRTIWLEFNKFLEYQSLETKDKIQYLLDNWIDDFNF